jgi:hypothetical protein
MLPLSAALASREVLHRLRLAKFLVDKGTDSMATQSSTGLAAGNILAKSYNKRPRGPFPPPPPP